MLAATCLSVAGGRGAHASTFLESSPLELDFSTISHSADVLPDGTVIVDAPPLIDSAIGLARFSNLPHNSQLKITSDDAGPGLEAFDGSDLLPPFEQEILTAASLTISTSAPGGILPEDLELEQDRIYEMTADDAADSGTSDSALLMLTGLGFTLVGTIGRRPTTALGV
jgi:hypothetical protein